MTDSIDETLQRVSETLARLLPVQEIGTDDDESVGLFEDASELLARHQLSDQQVLGAIQVKESIKKRAGLQRETLSELLPELPPIGAAVHLLSNANRAGNRQRGFSFSTFISHLIGLVDSPVVMSVSVWTMNNHSASEIIGFIRAGQIVEFNLCVDQYFVKREFETARLLASALVNTPHKFTVFRNHAKVIQMKAVDESVYVTVTGSGNLSSQPRIEQYHVTTSPGVYDFYNENLFRWVVEQAKSQHD